MAGVVITWTVIMLLSCNLYYRGALPPNITHLVEDDPVISMVKSDKWVMLWLASWPDNEIELGVSVADLVANLLILGDMITRITVCPYKIIYLKSYRLFEVIIVFLSGISQLVIMPIHGLIIEAPTSLRYLDLLYFFVAIMRPLLMTRLANTFIGHRVMQMVMKKSIAELLTIYSFLFTMMLMYGFFIFFAEIGVDGSFYSGWEGCWWALITMTTVGYGDFIPHNWPGYIVAAFCVIAGMIMTGLLIPILGNNFNRYYEHVHLAMEEIKDYTKNHRL
jgi:hypothetical protein